MFMKFSERLVCTLLTGFFVVTSANLVQAQAVQPTGLEAALLGESFAQLADDAKTFGDANRGALLFHQPGLGCATCHANGAGDSKVRRVGPNLTEFVSPVGDK